MTRLCSNRPEGFGPRSSLYSHILTSCFIDTILIPLCTWLFLLVLILLVSLSRRRSGIDASHPRNGKIAARRALHLGLDIIYALLLIAQILMCTLEIVRLALLEYGVGLLPFTYVTLLLAGLIHHTHGLKQRIAHWRWLNVAAFVALAVTNGVKVAELVKSGSTSRKTSKYPTSDQIIDVAVMIGVYAALVLFEGILYLLGRK